MDSRIKLIKGTAIPKPEPNQDTDDIIPSEFLNTITFKEMGKNVYHDERYDKKGTVQPEHPFNQEEYQGAKILVAGANYGCGSSRQHAVFAVYGWGIRVVIAPSYSMIFERSSPKVGLVTACVAQEGIDQLVQAIDHDPKTEFEVDLEKKEIRYDGRKLNFDMPEPTRQSLLTGKWDSLFPLKKNESGITTLEQELPYLKFK